MWERRIRMWSGLIVAFYVIPHVINHALGLASLETMEFMRRGMNFIWGPPVGAPLLLAAFLTIFYPLCLLFIGAAPCACHFGRRPRSGSEF